jgi:hypothetical protein
LIVVAAPLGSEDDFTEGLLLSLPIQNRRRRHLARARVCIQKKHLPSAQPLNRHVSVVGTFVLTVIKSLFESRAESVDAD